MRILEIMIANALIYHIGLALTLMGVSGGVGILMATTNLAMAYLLLRYAHHLQRILSV